MTFALIATYPQVQICAKDMGAESHSSVLRFRSVSEEDIEKLQSLYEECFPVSYPVSWFHNLLENPSLISIVAISDGDIIGVLVGTVLTLGNCSFDDRKLLSTSFPLSTNVAYILSLGVTGAYRSKGVASILLKSFIAYVSGENIEWLINFSRQVNLFNHPNISTTEDEYNNAEHFKNGNKTMSSLQWCTTDYQSLCNLHVLDSNISARHFYEKRGFICLHTRPGCYTIDGKSADGCTYVLHTNGGFLDVKPVFNLYRNSISHMIYEYLNEQSLMIHLRWMIRFLSQSGCTILFKLSRFLRNICDLPSISRSLMHNYQQEEEEECEHEDHCFSLSPTSTASLYSMLHTSTSSSCPSSMSSLSSYSSSGSISVDSDISTVQLF
ncbi:unnamed protein product [Heterobilharzia americana]|nr:unnamed protein product [Heterobilharzia americana]